MTKKPVRKMIAFITAVFTLVVMCGLPAVAFAWNGDITKEETVYVVTDSTGTQEDVIVSDHLVNKSNVKTISDETTLSDIENVKGEETFKQKGDSLTWDAEGNSIYYQGKTDAEVPVTMDIVYRLNDRIVSGSELQGQSGKVEIRIHYENNAEYEGTTVPFVVMTGLIVTDDSFKNIKISKGKVIDDGEKLLVVGMAAPGLAQTLGIGESELGFGSTVTITGDADKFAVEDMMTIVTNAFFEDVDADSVDLDYDDEIKQLDKGSKALVDGSDQLYEGLDTLADNMPELKKGVGQLKDGSDALKKGTNDAKKGAKDLADGAVELSKNIKDSLQEIEGYLKQSEKGTAEIKTGLGTLKTGIDSAESGLGQVETNMLDASEKLTKGAGYSDTASNAITAADGQIDAADGEINSALQSLEQGTVDDVTYANIKASLEAAMENTAGAKSYTAGAATAVAATKQTQEGYAVALGDEGQLYGGVDAVKTGLSDASVSLEKQIIPGITSVDNGLTQLITGINDNLSEKSKLSQGLNSLTKGTSDLSNGEVKIAEGASGLADGMTQLNDKADTMVNGVYQLDKGAYKLRKGMSQLYKEGIKKIVELYNNDLKGTLDNANSLLDAGKGYKTFTKLPSGMDGNVKFIYKTDMTN